MSLLTNKHQMHHVFMLSFHMHVLLFVCQRICDYFIKDFYPSVVIGT